MGELRVFDEVGKELERQFFVSIPPMSDAQTIVLPGQYRKFGFFIWNGGTVFPRPGIYYAIATFEAAWSGKANVVFTSAKRWFTVVAAPPKNILL